MKRRQLGGKLVWFAAGVVFAILRRDRILAFVVEPSIKERARTMHFCRAHIGVPVGHRPEARPGVKVYSSQAVGRWNQRAGPLSVGSETLPIFIKLRIKTARPPNCRGPS